jgi:hypothetical protein
MRLARFIKSHDVLEALLYIGVVGVFTGPTEMSPLFSQLHQYSQHRYIFPFQLESWGRLCQLSCIPLSIPIVRPGYFLPHQYQIRSRGGLTDPAGKNLLTGSEVSSWLGHDIPALVPCACISVPGRVRSKEETCTWFTPQHAD